MLPVRRLTQTLPPSFFLLLLSLSRCCGTMPLAALLLIRLHSRAPLSFLFFTHLSFSTSLSTSLYFSLSPFLSAFRLAFLALTFSL
jgi:hypothetical protein